MVPGIEEFYQIIGSSIVAAIPEKWTHAKMYAVFYSDHILYDGEYLLLNGEKRSFSTPIEAERAFRRIRELFKEAQQPLWCRASFELTPEGKFSTKWGYDDCDEKGFARFNEEADKKWRDAQWESLKRNPTS